jgi:hypothetical protein
MPNIEDFKQQLIGGGARSNLFRADVTIPNVVPGDSPKMEDMSFLIKATTFPASTIENIDVPYRGRMLKVAGDRTYENWSITVINDVDMKIRTAMENWMNHINNNSFNTAGGGGRLDYYQPLYVSQLDRYQQTTATYKFTGAYPISISAIDLAYDTNNTIQDFTVEFAYQFWNRVNPRSIS